jgi:hypothetical protein
MGVYLSAGDFDGTAVLNPEAYEQIEVSGDALVHTLQVARRALVWRPPTSRVSTRIPPRRSAVLRVHPDQHVRQLVVLVDGPG